MSGSSFFTKAGMPGYDPIRNAVFGIGDKKDSTPVDALPVPTPASPIGSTDQSVIQAEDDYARSNLLKKSIKKTIYAGDTGGYNPTSPAMGSPASPIGKLTKLA